MGGLHLPLSAPLPLNIPIPPCTENEKFVEGVDLDLRLRSFLDFFATLWPDLQDAEIAYMTKTGD